MWQHHAEGFLWIKKLVDLLDQYENNRDKYPTLADFMPEIVKLQNEIVTDEYIAKLQELQKRKEEEDSPQIMATNPLNGAKDVDPGITEISVTFDRPMSRGMAWYTTDGVFPERSDNAFPVWSDDKRTSTMQNVVLKPGTTYKVRFNTELEWNSNIPNDGFRCTDNIPLKPVYYTFTTKEATE
jgi:hypothetical protein